MPRPRRLRMVMSEPGFTYFKPAGIRMTELKESVLTVDEYEAVRLKDLEDMEQEHAARKMNISQPTFHRLLLSARKKITDAIVHGKAIKIKGGDYKMTRPGRGLGLGGGPRGRMGGFGVGPPGKCVCLKCGHKKNHAHGEPCYKIKCPECGAMMTRA